jgi:hypothetical protein
MKNSQKQSRFCFAACLLSAGFAPSVLAQAVSDADEVLAGAGEIIEEIITTGTRRTRMAVSSSPAPIQLINSEMLKESGAPDLMNTIAMQVPSYNANQRGQHALVVTEPRAGAGQWQASSHYLQRWCGEWFCCG